MGPEAVTIEISSDEEDFGLKNSDEGSFDWISELHGGMDEYDCVMVVDEFSSVVQKHNSASLRVTRDFFGEDSDDDCVILDADPDNPVSVVEDYRDGDGSGDLLIVGEKGQLACRDFPHSRHLCAEFPFNTTPHEKHCGQCHCYVCDSPAPCIYWGYGLSKDDHCHSTDEEGKWKARRKASKQSKTVTVHSQQLPDSTSITPPLNIYTQSCNSTTIPPSNLMHFLACSETAYSQTFPVATSIIPPPKINTQSRNSTTIPSNLTPLRAFTETAHSQNLPVATSITPQSRNSTTIPSSNLTPLRPCSAARVEPPNPISQRHKQRSAVPSYHGQRFGQHLTRSQLLVPGRESKHKESRGGGAFVPQVYTSHSKFKRVGSTGGRRITVNVNQAQYSVSTNQVASVQVNYMKQWKDIVAGLKSDIRISEKSNKHTTASQPGTVLPQPPVCSQSLSQTNASPTMNLSGHSASKTTKPDSLDFGYSLLNDTTSQNLLEQDPVSGESNLDSWIAYLEQQ